MDTAQSIKSENSNRSDLLPFLVVFYQHFHTESLFQMYISLVCTHFDYASQVWNTYETGKIHSPENMRSSELVVMAVFSAVTPAALDLCTMFKMVCGLFYFPSSIFVEHASRVTRHILINSLSLWIYYQLL